MGCWGNGGCWDDDITSDEMDHSRRFPTFSTSKSKFVCNNYADLCTMQSSKGCFFVCMVSKIEQH